MFESFKKGIKSVTRGFNSTPSNVDSGPLSFFTNWFNPNNSVGELQQLEQYTGIVYACVSAIAEDVAKIKFSMHKPAADGTPKPVVDHPFLKLLKNPNPTQSDYEFIEMTQTHIELTGEAFWYVPKGAVSSKPKELWIMRPDLVQVVFDQDNGEPTGYVFSKFNGRVQIPLELDEVIHFKMPNPINPYRGMGTVEAGIVYIQTEQYSAKFSRNFLANNATPAGILNFKGTIPDTEFQKVKRQWTREYGSVENAGKTAFVRNADVNYQKIGSSLQDIDLKELKNLTRDDIMFMFRVSKPILGITEDVNYANAQTAEYIFAKRVVDPKMNRIVDTLQTFYNKRYNDNNVVTYVTPVPQNTDEKINYYKSGVNLWLTPNEVRLAEGMEEIDGGDTLRMPFNLVSIATPARPTSQATVPTEDPNSAGGTKAKILVRRTITRTKDVNEITEGEVVTEDAATVVKENFRKLMNDLRDMYTPKLEDVTREALAQQEKLVLSQLKATKAKAIDADSIDYGTDGAAENIRAGYEPLVLELMAEAGALSMTMVDPALEFELEEASVKRIQERIAKVAKDFSEQTQEALAKVIKQGVDDGLALSKIRKNVEEVLGVNSDYRTERLARTEVSHESNAATLDAYKQSGIVVKKEWYAGGGNPCEFCLALNHTIVKTEEVFVAKGSTVDGVDGGKYLADYENVEAGGLHPNCSCTILPVTD